MKTIGKITLISIFISCFILSGCVSTGTETAPQAKTEEITSFQQAAAKANDAETHYENKEWRHAIENYTIAIDYAENNPRREGTYGQYLVRWYSGRSLAWKNEGDLVKARADVDKAKAIKEIPENWIGSNLQILYILASCRIYAELGDYDAAIKEITGYIDMFSMQNLQGPYPKIDYAFYYRGVFYYYAGDYKKAVEDFDMAVSSSSYQYDEIEDKEQPWEIMSAASIKARGKNTYAMIIRDTEKPNNLLINQTNYIENMEINQKIYDINARTKMAALNKYNVLRRSNESRELIIVAGRYEVKAPDRSGLILTGSSRVSNTEIVQYYRETVTSGQVFHPSNDFLPGIIYNITPWEITVKEGMP